MTGFKAASIVFSLLLSTAARAADVPSPPAAPVEVMVVAVFHMSNPGRDLHNLQVDDVLTPKRQAEIASVTDALARFKPTQVGVEWPTDAVAERYPQYLAGTLAPSRNEVVQLGFRLAKTAGSAGVHSLDADGAFPYERLKNFADSHGRFGLLEDQNAIVQKMMDEQGRRLAEGGVGPTLRFLNDPTTIREGNGFYRTMLRIGAGDDQPGADLVAAWQHRNLLICANLIQLAKPGDRIVVFFGAGHAFLLRQCVTETPGFRLVEAEEYLPK